MNIVFCFICFLIFLFFVLQSLPVFIFANQAGLDMLETTLVALQDITLDNIFDDNGRKALYAEFPKIMQQVITNATEVIVWSFYLLCSVKLTYCPHDT